MGWGFGCYNTKVKWDSSPWHIRHPLWLAAVVIVGGSRGGGRGLIKRVTKSST
ncbi:hypothetical protein Hanom_Chr17g01579091 [Helianthus anomalus]